MKCWKLAFNAQGSRLIIVALQVRAVKIYVVTTLIKKERHGSPQKPHPWMLMGFFFEFHPIYDQIEGFNVVFLIL
jgi:hypothetical protein